MATRHRYNGQRDCRNDTGDIERIQPKCWLWNCDEPKSPLTLKWRTVDRVAQREHKSGFYFCFEYLLTTTKNCRSYRTFISKTVLFNSQFAQLENSISYSNEHLIIPWTFSVELKNWFYVCSFSLPVNRNEFRMNKNATVKRNQWTLRSTREFRLFSRPFLRRNGSHLQNYWIRQHWEWEERSGGFFLWQQKDQSQNWRSLGKYKIRENDRSSQNERKWNNNRTSDGSPSDSWRNREMKKYTIAAWHIRSLFFCFGIRKKSRHHFLLTQTKTTIFSIEKSSENDLNVSEMQDVDWYSISFVDWANFSDWWKKMKTKWEIIDAKN